MKIELVQTAAQLQECLQIRQTVFIKEKGVPKEIEIDAMDDLQSSCTHFLVCDGKNPIGTFQCANMDKNTIKVQRLCFLKESRGKGFGRQALVFLEAWSRQQNKNRIEIDAKQDVYPFYEKCGYQKISDPFLEADIPHVRMEKRLDMGER